MKRTQSKAVKPARKGAAVKHVVDEGSREHVVSYDQLGAFCSCWNCEINLPKFRRNPRAARANKGRKV